MLALAAASLALAGCSDWTMYLAAQCSDPVGVGDDPSHLPRACSTEDAGSACECVGVPTFWNGPTWLWQGATEQAPSCDGDSFYVGYTDFVGGGACELCTCEPPTGTCALPSQLTVSTKACNIPGGSSSSFDAPLDWDGQCDGSTLVPAGVARSLTVAPLVLMESACLPGPPVPAKVIPAKGTTIALGCHGQGWLVCGDIRSSVCIPHDDVPRPGFRLCILKEGDHDCPPTFTFTERHRFYEKAEEECSDCSCGPPEGSLCKAKLSVYEDGTCSGPPVEQISIGSTASTCVDIVPSGQVLASKSAEPPMYVPGACQPQGGQVSGMITGINPSTICCRP